RRCAGPRRGARRLLRDRDRGADGAAERRAGSGGGRARKKVIAPDSSVVIAPLAPWHEAHHPSRAAIQEAEVRLPAHVAFETTSALSRMPKGRRIAPAVVLTALERDFAAPWL